MSRFAFVFLLVVATNPSFARAEEPSSAGTTDSTVAAAKESFDQLVEQWGTLAKQIQQQRAQGGSEANPQLREQSEALVGQIVAAGLDVYQADPNSYPKVNNTLLTIAGFYVLGDLNGDGGDQYEKALPIIEPMLAAGAGGQWPQLWLWGGVSAFAINRYELAEQYLEQAKQAGLLSASPPVRDSKHPSFRAWSLGRSFVYGLKDYPSWWNEEQQLRQAEAEADDLPRVKLTTTQGEVVIELFENEAPQAVANFLTLVKSGYYNGITFHRVLSGFMAQGGCPDGTGRGGPGYNIRCECHQAHFRKHFRGSLSMAHAGLDTGGSQFFLTFIPVAREDPRSRLNGKHTVFGRVIEGMEVAAAIRRRDPDVPQPATPDRIVKAEVLRDRGHSYPFEKLPGR